MKDLIFMIVSTVIVAVIWAGLGGEINKLLARPEKVLDNPIPISGRIDLEFFEELGGEVSPFDDITETQETSPAL